MLVTVYRGRGRGSDNKESVTLQNDSIVDMHWEGRPHQ